MDNTALKKYFCDDTVFNTINKKFITLQDEEVKRNNKYLDDLINTIMNLMKSKDPLFEKTFKEVAYCGSIYKGTRVGHPNEFDLNIVVELPLIINQIMYSAEQAAFVQIGVKDDLSLLNKPKYCDLPNKYRKLLKGFVREGLLNPDKFRQWIEGIMSKVIDKFSSYWSFADVRVKKSGPAFTLILDIPEIFDIISVDLAPALAFDRSLFKGNVRKLNQLQEYRSNIWYAIPLPFKERNENLYWRISLCNQEKELLSKYGRMKPVIRQMKKLRDVQNWKSIASYYIETLFLNKLDELHYDINKIPLTLFFYVMLKELFYACECHEIQFFWDETYNLLDKISKIEMTNISYRLNNIIKDVEKNIMTNKLILAKYILTKFELSLIEIHYNVTQAIDDFLNVNSEESSESSESLQENWSCVIL